MKVVGFTSTHLRYHNTKSVIGEVRCCFIRIYAPTLYSAVFLLHAPAPIKIGFGAVRYRCGLAVWVGLIWIELG